MANPYCNALGIEIPRLETVMDHAGANTYSLLVVALLERGGPLTLEEVAARFEEAGVAPFDRALLALKRSRPAKAPIYREGDLYALDPHHEDANLWVFRLDLRPPREPAAVVPRPEPVPLPSLTEPLPVSGLDEALSDGVPGGWSAQRIAICVLDAHGVAMQPEHVLAFVAARSRWNPVSSESARYWRSGAPVRVRDDGAWELDLAHDAVRSAREAVREQVVLVRRRAAQRGDPTVWEANRKRAETEREANTERLAGLRRVVVHAFPSARPEGIVLLDVDRREMRTFLGAEIAEARRLLAEYDVIVALEVRALLRALDFDPGGRRMADLGPPQKSKKLNKRGRTLKITTSLLIQRTHAASAVPWPTKTPWAGI